MKEGYEDQLDFISDYIRVRKEKLLGKVIDVEYLKKYLKKIKDFDKDLDEIKENVDKIMNFEDMDRIEEEDETTPEELEKLKTEAEDKMERMLE